MKGCPLQTIDLYTTNEWFMGNKRMVYSKQTNGLWETNEWFIANKSMVYNISLTPYSPLSLLTEVSVACESWITTSTTIIFIIIVRYTAAWRAIKHIAQSNALGKMYTG